MAIIHDPETKHTVDQDTGEYLVMAPTHYQDPYLHCTIYHADGAPLFGADVERNAVDETGNSGGATLVRYVVRKAWVPSGRPARPTPLNEDGVMIAKLRAFLEARQRARRFTPDPRFEFSDERPARKGLGGR